ncbi:unnamed protein product [Cladocopium goreaui]|uniref:Uncharacterized protein n=1 Tax=Cladocopium goreaui TaxID=2562237 RepID=A0A9P1CZC9_9DINO|nr:unnamed protein product [Cladocopium goreaui]
MDDWTELDRIDASLVKALKPCFPTALQVATAFDDLEGARHLVEDALGNSYGVARREAIAQALFDWQATSHRRLKRMQLFGVRDRLEFGKQLDQSGLVSTMADNYESIVTGSPTLGLAALESRLAKRAKTSSTARSDEDAEELAKKKWALVLAEFITESKLPAVPTEHRLSGDRLWLETVKAWTAELSRDAPPKRQADLYTVAIEMSSELVLDNLTAPIGQRFYSFVLLLLLWGTMRCDDLQNVDPSSLELSQLGLKFVLRRTKTSGPGKPVGELHGFIAREVSLTGVDWLKLGMDLLEDDEVSFQRDFFAVSFSDDWMKSGPNFLEPEGLATMLRRLLLVLPTVVRRGGGLVEEELMERVKAFAVRVNAGITEADMKAYLHDRVEGDLAFILQVEVSNLQNRAAVAGVVAAWEASKEYASKQAELKAEARLLGVTRPVTQTDRAAMRAAYVATHGEIEETFEPSDDYLSTKIEELEAHADLRSLHWEATAVGGGGCNRVHICRVRGCGKSHPMWQHYQGMMQKGYSFGCGVSVATLHGDAGGTCFSGIDFLCNISCLSYGSCYSDVSRDINSAGSPEDLGQQDAETFDPDKLQGLRRKIASLLRSSESGRSSDNWTSEFQPDMKNYATAEMSSDQLEDHFRKDEQLGRPVMRVPVLVYVTLRFLKEQLQRHGHWVNATVSSQLLANGVRMRLRWRPREENVPADAITNGDHSLFDVKNRVEFSLDDLPLSFFRELCASRNEFMSLRETQVDVKLAEGKQSKRQKLANKTAW